MRKNEREEEPFERAQCDFVCVYLDGGHDIFKGMGDVSRRATRKGGII